MLSPTSESRGPRDTDEDEDPAVPVASLTPRVLLPGRSSNTSPPPSVRLPHPWPPSYPTRPFGGVVDVTPRKGSTSSPFLSVPGTPTREGGGRVLGGCPVPESTHRGPLVRVESQTRGDYQVRPWHVGTLNCSRLDTVSRHKKGRGFGTPWASTLQESTGACHR